MGWSSLILAASWHWSLRRNRALRLIPRLSYFQSQEASTESKSAWRCAGVSSYLVRRVPVAVSGLAKSNRMAMCWSFQITPYCSA
jgi:hypothetical protein